MNKNEKIMAYRDNCDCINVYVSGSKEALLEMFVNITSYILGVSKVPEEQLDKAYKQGKGGGVVDENV